MAKYLMHLILNDYIEIVKNYDMKKLLLILLLMPFLNLAQNHFKKIAQKESINTIIVDSKMLELMSNIDMNTNNTDSKEYQKLIKSITDLKVFIDEEGKHKTEMINAFQSYISKNNLKEKKVKNNNVICYTKAISNSSKFSEFLLFTENINKQNENVILFIKGNFELKQVDLLIKKMKIPGIKQFSNFQ